MLHGHISQQVSMGKDTVWGEQGHRVTGKLARVCSNLWPVGIWGYRYTRHPVYGSHWTCHRCAQVLITTTTYCL